MDKISIIVPIYNVEPYIHKCVDSILNQTYKNIEVILVDDGSPDNCGKICDEYAEKDDRVVVIHKENGGLSDARNAGLDKATGECIGFVDSDDYIAPNMYEKLYAALKENEAEIAYCNVVRCLNENYYYNTLQQSKVMTGPEYLFGKHAAFWTIAVNKLYKRSLFINVRYPKGKLHEDEFVIHEIMFSCNKVIYIQDNLYYYIHRDSSITNMQKNIRHFDGAEAAFKRAEYYKANSCANIVICDTLLSGIKRAAYIYYFCKNQDGAKARYKEMLKIYRHNISFKMLKDVSLVKSIEACIWYIIPYEIESLIIFLKNIKNKLIK